MKPQQEAGAMIAHYLKALTQRAGLKWTAENDKDMQRLAQLLTLTYEQADTIAPFLPVDPPNPHATVVFDKPERTPQEWAASSPDYVKWQERRKYDDAEDAAGMLRRERGR